MNTHDEAPERSRPIDTQGDFELATWQSFIKSMRGFWRTEAYAAVVSSVEPRMQPAELELQYASLPAYRLYAWLERYSQQLKYYGRRGLVTRAEAQAAQCRALLGRARELHPERLAIDDRFEVPAYVRDSHTHQHVGGVWDDPEDAFAYEASTEGFSFALGDADAPMKVYADAAKELAHASSGPVDKVIDVGCAIGGSTRALKSAFPHARVTGVDVCAPAVLLAHLRALERGEELHFAQRAAEDLRVEAGSVDLVASHWLYHEMPVRAIRAALREAWRVLRPGGLFLAYDMYLVPGASIGEWLHAGYARRNNEPFALGFSQMDLRRELEAAGFVDVEIRLAFPQPLPEQDALPPERTHYLSLITCMKSPGSGVIGLAP